MKLLSDENLSFRLVEKLADLYPGSEHVKDAKLLNADDSQVWAYAKTGDFIIVSKDSDFNDMVVIQGVPPKIIWLKLNNCSTATAESQLRANFDLVCSPEVIPI